MGVCLHGGGAGNHAGKTCDVPEGDGPPSKLFSCRLDRSRAFCPNLHVQENVNGYSRRREELLAKLEERAKACPGLYPVQCRDEFLRLATDLGTGGEESLCRILEGMWHRPDEALQIHAQSLIRRGQGWAGQGAAGQRSDKAAR
ncbi:MAG: hypothetical protein EB090_00195 [Verrucomicrobia bacterium]|nr:hypothetical protein [Verrucomicrobiota bacterium]